VFSWGGGLLKGGFVLMLSGSPSALVCIVENAVG
jgi:hypothetical protein